MALKRAVWGVHVLLHSSSQQLSSPPSSPLPLLLLQLADAEFSSFGHPAHVEPLITGPWLRVGRVPRKDLTKVVHVIDEHDRAHAVLVELLLDVGDIDP